MGCTDFWYRWRLHLQRESIKKEVIMAIAPFVWALWQTRTGRVLICLFLLYLVIGLLGWWFIPVVLLLIGGVWLQNRQDEQKRKKEQDKLKEEYKRLPPKLRNQLLGYEDNKPWEPENKRELTWDMVVPKIEMVLKFHPDAVGDLVFHPIKDIYRIYWLEIKNENKSYRDLLRVKFGMSKDFMGMNVTITNMSDDVIEINWPSFKIDRSWVFIDHKNFILYKGEGKLEPGDKATKFIQSLKYRQEDDKFNRMFDLRAICKEEKTYHVTFSAIVDNIGETVPS